MLWYKGWLETRFKVLAVAGLLGLILTSAYSRGVRTPVGIQSFIVSAMYLGVMIPVMFAGAGITTQLALRATQGLHGSMMFTLSLPASRLRLLAVRAGLGWLEMAAAFGVWCCALWILFPVLRDVATAAQLFEHEVALVACASGLYAINVFLATFLDDLWRTYGSMIASGALWWLSDHTPLPASANIFQAMGEGSPLFAHAMPWTAMTFSLSLAAILFLAALKIVQAREY
jgi:hypothetical protein